jgi:hypothetical protein
MRGGERAANPIGVPVAVTDRGGGIVREPPPGVAQPANLAYRLVS